MTNNERRALGINVSEHPFFKHPMATTTPIKNRFYAHGQNFMRKQAHLHFSAASDNPAAHAPEIEMSGDRLGRIEVPRTLNVQQWLAIQEPYDRSDLQ